MASANIAMKVKSAMKSFLDSLPLATSATKDNAAKATSEVQDAVSDASAMFQDKEDNWSSTLLPQMRRPFHKESA